MNNQWLGIIFVFYLMKPTQFLICFLDILELVHETELLKHIFEKQFVWNLDLGEWFVKCIWSDV